MPRSNEPGRTVGSRQLDILFAFRPGRSRLTLADLTRDTGLPHATVRRHVHELLSAGALERGEDGRFTVGLRLWQLGTLAPLSLPLRTVALPFMEDLHTALDEHVQLAVRDGDHAVLIERFSSRRAISIVSQVGQHLPLHCSAVGKVLLAHASEETISRVADSRLRRFTDRTITDPVELRQVLAECRSTGFGISREELSVNADSVATRILNSQGNVVAALSVVVRTGSVNLSTVRPSVITAGLSVSRCLGWTPAVGVQS
ncbi:IclR family transcriptional regulator [Streptomyces cavernicola]|uniref:IclR family transcriptional regulator n=1 Tax=Streptomyces cavernicola TaxID=3043613 RepID=A0ABT6S7B8_9ACTN|nr:IclR family transcriptional regulator [Streptomyces sp. B-S-A6]MDI3403211.1 IclR family transcriptional regulator [Streptomyces sp. B-S-A6]